MILITAEQKIFVTEEIEWQFEVSESYQSIRLLTEVSLVQVQQGEFESLMLHM